VTVTLLEGLVLARSSFRHSVNYRPVVLVGPAEKVVDDEETSRALDAIVDQVVARPLPRPRPTSSLAGRTAAPTVRP
jgi:uncharacterized protein